MMNQIKRIIAMALACATLFCTAAASYSQQNDLDPNENDATVGTYENRLVSDETAAKSDEEILTEILADPSVSDETKNQLLLKEELYQEALNALESGNASRRATNYFVDVDPIMQDDDTKCGPATIQMVLKHKNIDYDTQSRIQKAISYQGSTDLELIMNYLNERQNNHYARKTYANETQLLAFFDVAAQLDLPVIHTAKATQTNVKNGVWPYRTNGHFFILCGRNSRRKYVVSDPFYYPEYVSDVDEEGRHYHIFDDLFTVSTNYGKTDGSGNLVGYIGY